jgi:acyl-CoA synthetase (AMP-forming)/AMP-acid ligase II
MQYQLADLFESVVDTVPDREALVCDPVRLTYTELEERCNQLAHHLREAGIKRGDKVGCHMPNQTPYVETMIACFKIGAVPVNVNYRYVEDELRYIYDNADLACVVFDAEFADLVKAVAPDIDTLRHLVVTGDTDGVDLPDGAVPYEEALAAQPTTRDDLLDGRRPTTCTCSTPAARPACPRVSCGATRTCSLPAWAAATPSVSPSPARRSLPSASTRTSRSGCSPPRR